MNFSQIKEKIKNKTVGIAGCGGLGSNCAVALARVGIGKLIIADFDIIELQFGHGYLLAQFISPKVNDKTDEYGGSFENRIKFPLEVLEAVKSTVDLPVIVRISGDEMIPDGIKLPEMIQFSKILKEKSSNTLNTLNSLFQEFIIK